MFSNLYQRALNEFGHEQQIGVFHEECGEVIAAINRHRRGRSPIMDVCEELADLEIMLDQMKMIYGEDQIATIKHMKLERLERRLDEIQQMKGNPNV